MTTASTPATPGPSTPTTVRTFPLDQVKISDLDEDIIPPDRPKSTPFPEPDLLEGDIQCSLRPNGSERQDDYRIHSLQAPQSESSSSALNDLPTEIHEQILDHLSGVRSSASSRTTAGKSKALRGWGTALRHSRRREVSELALVSNKWRELIQDRLYRHLKIKGTRESVEQSMYWFCMHPHLRPYVKHIEIWFPVFQQKNPAFDRTLRIPLTTPDRSTLIRSLANLADSGNAISYQSPSNNCTLEEVFAFIQMTFEEACILTLEGGERKKPPMVRQFVGDESFSLPLLEKIRTLVCKGQWNIIRSFEDFQNIALALPNLQEWHGSYAKPKSKSYISMATILPKLPTNLTHLNICLEADYRREAVSPLFFKKVGLKTHFCVDMAKAIPTLEHLVYTGRVCHSFFDNAAKLSNPRESRLKSVDLIIKNICRPTFLWNDGSGITDMAFILAFEALVLSGVKSLDRLSALDFLRIRFIDLESPLPALNPYFNLNHNQCTGIWSDAIVDALARTRPKASFVEKSENLGDIGFKDGQLLGSPVFSKTRPLSVKVSSYMSLSGGITIN
ncbi:uncharacterized protein K444DRAFT_545809 [Hyaloscypha bicolor E]|uniref:Uncharacterized protein n=1 Tax=Hyaloscypha bicolor E TaxID=1095630 RepID=A0A2J6SK71_9HELO|nr:uncharacterized protein K444DRAFT_545809 [Hyaloscypha bicolor E]PMD51157.1 hypothetical protein K444DRAFT_545809 [Hyaloscypha bicolor E]